MSDTFLKYDSDKGCSPTLIPVGFRAGIREMTMIASKAEHPDIGQAYLCMEAYERAELDAKILLGAAIVLQTIYEADTSDSFLMGVARVMDRGARKYAPNNWKKCPYDERYRYIDAFYRHTWAWENDDRTPDPESGESHLLHAGCCLLMLHGVDLIYHRGDH